MPDAVGLFLSEYVLDKGVPGGARADLHMAVDPRPGRNIISGAVTITQPVSPPLNITINIQGWFVTLKHEVVVFVKNTIDGLVGQPEFHAILTMPRWGAPGEGEFWFHIGSTAYDSGPVPAKPVEVAAMANA